MNKPAVMPAERVLDSIFTLRDKRVILDADLARFYGVSTKRLNEAVRRNAERFPADFMFTLTTSEKTGVVANCGHLRAVKFSPVLPKAFTEHGAIMAATLLNSPQAVQMSILVVRAFVKMREELAGHRELAFRLKEIERQLTARLDGHEQTILELVEQMKQFMYPPVQEKPPIGFREKVTTERVSRKRKAAA